MKSKRTWAEIDLRAVTCNTGFVRNIIGGGVKLMAVVKADGYGHGAAEVSRATIRGGADCLGVAICEEGISLRESGIDAPILILGYTPEDMMPDAVRLGLAQTVFDLETAAVLSRIAAGLNKTAAIHIKIDTGMNRLGFPDVDESVEDIVKICGLPWLRPDGVFTHFAAADNLDRSFTHKQADDFDRILGELSRRGVNVGTRHAANSAAAIIDPRFHYDMVRTGIAIYGLRPSNAPDFYDLDLKPALSLRARISRIRKIESGATVGYGRTFTAGRETIIATIPVGYADGYAHELGNKAEILLRGQRVPVVGTICMDQLMADITDIKGEVSAGEIVTLIGADGGEYVSAGEIAALRGTISYEVISGISVRVPRIYKTQNIFE